MTEPPEKPNMLGNTSLWLGVASSALVFGIGSCALSGLNQRWIVLAGTPLFVCSASSAFLGFLAIILGGAGLLGGGRSRATAIAGLVLGLIGFCLFFAFITVIQSGG